MKVFYAAIGALLLFMSVVLEAEVDKNRKLECKIETLSDSLRRRPKEDLMVSLPVNKDSFDFITDTLNDTAVYKALVFFDIPNPKVVLAQAKLETGHYRKVPSGNLFGLRQRNGSYMRFSHWTESILSYKKYISSKYKGQENTEAYLAFLTRLGYAESPNYNRVLRVIVKNVEQLEFVD